MEIHFSEANEKRLKNLAEQEGVLPSDILETPETYHFLAENC